MQKRTALFGLGQIAVSLWILLLSALVAATLFEELWGTAFADKYIFSHKYYRFCQTRVPPLLRRGLFLRADDLLRSEPPAERHTQLCELKAQSEKSGFNRY